MAYTETELTQIRKAIVDLSTGQQVARITKDGRTVEYARTALEDLRQLERDITSQLQRQQKRQTRTRYVITSKGL